MNINIPKKFNKIISLNQNLYGSLTSTFARFSDWINDNKLEFFPEYTDHGIQHINSVLNSSEDLISEESYDLLTPNDIYVLCVSILLHDCAMHINRDGLWDLLENQQYNGMMLGFDNDIEWKEKWNEFRKKVDRYTEPDWINLYSEFRDICFPDINATALDDNQKILIGDFIRQHHAAIAQLIANTGIPSKNGPYIILSPEFSYLNQLAGFIARSHNMHLRRAIDLLGNEKSRTHRDTHPAFLMGVLRIADYLQFKSERTPKILFSIKSFCSPISIKEWKKHLSIISTNNSHPDEELLFVEAFPEDSIVLNSIKNLLNGFQTELDGFWAVNGEIYSRYKPLNKFGIIYRRVKSNIDNPIKYVSENHKNYHPEVLKIDSDNQKLFPLLVKPLYGDLACIGVRELLQNSIDACNERYALENNKIINLENINYGIKITLDFDNQKFIIEDEGIGMNVGVIKDYFLKIGASYRASEAWKTHFVSDEKSILPRTGKFGIGMLAGFLIGDKIEIHTQHINRENKSVIFDYEVDSDHIELRFEKKECIGTKLIVHTTKTKLEEITKSFDLDYNGYSRYRANETLTAWWYVFDTPIVTVTKFENTISTEISPKYIINKSSLVELKDWNCINSERLDNYFWKISNKNLVFCNGINVHESQDVKIIIDIGLQSVDISEFEILFFDNKGCLPISLTREKFLVDDFYESDKLKNSFLDTFSGKIKKLRLNYKFGLDLITRAMRIHGKFFRCNLYRGNPQYIPIIFTEKNIEPLLSQYSANELSYILVDFVYENLSRGLIYRDIYNNLIDNNVGLSLMVDCDKNPETIYLGIFSILLKRKKDAERYIYWSNSTYSSINEDVFDGWIFIKKYDLEKIEKGITLNDADKFISFKGAGKIILSDCKDDWICIQNETNKEDYPDFVNELLSKTKKEFIFGVIKPKKHIISDILF